MIITGYEILSDGASVGGSLDGWSTWARVLKELSHVLLVSYSALNPLAYCGELLLRAGKKISRRIGQTSRTCLSCFGCHLKTNSNSRFCQSEFEMMKSVGITLNGADPIPQQLQELDAQSRILSGLPAIPPPPNECYNSKHSTSSNSTCSSFGILKKSAKYRSDKSRSDKSCSAKSRSASSNSSSVPDHAGRRNLSTTTTATTSTMATSTTTTQIHQLEKPNQQSKV